MGYAVYQERGRWAGYGVPALCDMQGCQELIDRGLDYKCEPHEGYIYLQDGLEVAEDDEWDEERPEMQPGCGLFFCSTHQAHHIHVGSVPTPDVPEWTRHILRDFSWADWRAQHRDEEARMLASLAEEPTLGDREEEAL